MDERKQTDTEYLSLKEFLTGIQDYIREISLHRKIFFFFLVLCLSLGVYNRWKSKKIYEAELSFMINAEQSSASPLGLAFGQIGGLLSGGTDVNLQKILELAKSRQIAERVFSAKTLIRGKEDFMANHLIEELSLNANWAETPFYKKTNPLKEFRFTHFLTRDFNEMENRALIELHKAFNEALVTQVSEKTSIMKLSLQLSNEPLCYEMTRRWFDELSQFYIDKMVEKQRISFLDLKRKTDSLKILIESKQYKLAGIKDNVRSTWLYHEDVPKTILDQEIRMLQLVYGETLKNREIASFSLDTKTPFIQAIDLPVIPLKSIQQSWLKAILLALMYGFVLGAGIICLRKFFRDLLM